MEDSINIETLDFKTLIENALIKVPRIQRDYAQGRDDEKATSVRENFVKSLAETIKSADKPLTLDFIYGYRINCPSHSEFIPLDGQQRLTTLFLLHWLIGINVVKDENNYYQSLLTYATRISSSEFCNRLSSIKASQLLAEINLKRISKNGGTKEETTPSAENKYENGESTISKPEVLDNSDLDKLELEDLEKLIFTVNHQPENVTTEESIPSLSQVITNRNKLFKWSWKFDPTIKGMLKMLDALVTALVLDKITYDKEDLSIRNLQIKIEETQKKLSENLSNITFQFLNLGELHKENKRASSDLYIKMNARGKELSDFDLLKSAIEQDIVEQQINSSRNDNNGELLETQRKWRESIDGNWLNLFWTSYAKKNGEVTLESAKFAEEQLRLMLLRLIARQLIVKMESAYKVNKSNFESRDGIPQLWKDYIQNESLKIDYSELIYDFNSLYYKDDSGKCQPITFLLDESIRWDPTTKKDEFYNFLDDTLANDKMLAFHLLVIWCREYPYSEAISEEEKSAWKSNFNRWMRLVRNVVINDNNDTYRIDSYYTYITKHKDHTEWFSEGGFAVGIDIKDPDGLTKRLQSLKNDHTSRRKYSYLHEEIEKSCFSTIDTEWKNLILEAENNHYLWGQILSLLDWSKGDKTDFSNYMERWNEIFEFYSEDSKTNRFTIQVATLANFITHLQFNITATDDIKIGRFDQNRDFSVKRLLRDKENETSGYRFLLFIEDWISKKPNSKIDEWCKIILEECFNNPKAPNWLRFLCRFPLIAGDCDTQRICMNPELSLPGSLRRKKRDDAGFYDMGVLALKHMATDRGYITECYHDRVNDSDKRNMMIAKNPNSQTQISVQLKNPERNEYEIIKNGEIIALNSSPANLIETFTNLLEELL